MHSETKGKKKEIIYFLSHPIQYFSPLLREMAKRMELIVYYFSDASIKGNVDKGFGQPVKWDTPLLEGYDYRFLKNFSGKKNLDNRLFDVFNPAVIKTIRKSKAPILIVNGWSYSSTLMAIFFGKLFGKEVWLRAESPLNQELHKSKLVIFLKKIFLKEILFNLFVSKCLYIGIQSKRFFEFYGVPQHKLVFTPYSVDNAFFIEKKKELKKRNLPTRLDLGLPVEKKIILYCGKYIPKKRPMDLIKAFHLMNDGNCALVMVGEGGLRNEMEQYINSEKLQHVYLTGFINQSLISNYYAVADVFVMCSGLGETWGLSVNEAMNFEKPVIVSETCGCCEDLVEYGENGYTFKEGDVKELSDKLSMILHNDQFRFEAGKRSAEIIKGFSIEKIAENIEAALN